LAESKADSGKVVESAGAAKWDDTTEGGDEGSADVAKKSGAKKRKK
jgi:hypothetical protein